MGYYREYTVPTPGVDDRGARRIVAGDDGESSTGPTTTTARSRGSGGRRRERTRSGLLAGHEPPGIYLWHGAFDVADVRHTVEHAGWGFGCVDGWTGADTKPAFLAAVGRGARLPRPLRAELRRPRRLPPRHRAGRDGVVLLWDGWSTLARADEKAFSIALSVLGSRVNAERGVPFAVLLRGEGPVVARRHRASTDATAQTARWVAAAASSTSTSRACVVDVGCPEGLDRVVGQLADDRLDLRARAGVVDDAAQLVDVGAGERRAERGVEALGRGAGSGIEREGDEHRALALDQVVAGRLARRPPGRRTPRAGRRAAGTPRPAAGRSGRAARAARAWPRRGRRRCGSGARWSTWRTCSAAPSSPCRRPPGRAPARRRRGTGPR